ncbi:MAG: DNA polymerase III subunit alpha [Oscillospiraceae bacterium]|nr:DNA polymerase III subunit alpha [Oscillospiraceae bacterium]
MEEFVHLNVHTAYSLLDGACRINELAAKAKALGQSALAITDNGALYGAVEFFDACKENGIKPIIGCETAVAEGSRNVPRLGAAAPYKLILLCKNAAGYRSLCRIIAEQNNIGGAAVTDKASLSEHSEGLIAVSCAAGGEIARLLSDGKELEALVAADEYKLIFGEDFYLEIVNHNTREEAELCAAIREFSEKTGILTLPSNNVHYVEKIESGVQRVLSCIGLNIRASQPDPNALPSEEFYLKGYDEMRLMFTEEELRRTVEVAEKCSFEFEFGVKKLPLFTKDGVSDNAAYLAGLCGRGAEKRYGTLSGEIRERLSHELSVIDNMGFTDYFLIVWDFVRYAKKNGIAVGPGRGSAAGSLCAYCLGITDTDPLRFSLLFERFLNPERVSMPDIDIDFCAERRDEVVEYVKKRYGADRVAQIVAFDTMKARGSVHNAGRVLGTPEDKINRAANTLPRFGSSSLKEELESGELRGMYDSDPEIKRLIDTAMSIEGLPKNVSLHAPGVLITRDPVREYIPLNRQETGCVAQYPAPQLERLGLLKMDFLSLRNLTVIEKTCAIIRKTQPDFDIRRVDETDAEVFAMLGRGGTSGVFQFESEGITSLLVRLKPRSIEDLAAANALYRPGPMDSIPAYLENRHKPPDQIVYKHPLLKPILEVTYGCIVYQEQVMEICRVVAGYSYGRADIVRRAMSKKKHDVMDRERQAFVYGSDTNIGAVANGVPEAAANAIFDELVKFASYAFNKSHSAAYAQVAYQTAYLRCHFYLDYMCETITNAIGDNAASGRVPDYIADLRGSRVRILLPDVNKSQYGFSAENGCVRFGLCGISGVGELFARAIVAERESGGEFTSAADFAVRMSKHKNTRRVTESLIMSGAFDCFPQNRRTLFESAEALVDFGAAESDRIESGQLDLFGDGGFGDTAREFAFKNEEEFTAVRRLEAEREYLGMYISAHPADVYLDRSFDDCVYIEDALFKNNGAAVSITALCVSARAFTDKKGSLMAFADFEDVSGQAGAVIFADKLQSSGRPRVGTVYCVKARLSIRDGKRSLQIEGFENAAARPEKPRPKLYVKLRSEDDPRADQVKNALFANKGVGEVLICFENTRKSRGIRGLRGVRVCPPLINALKRICGEENVVVK